MVVRRRVVGVFFFCVGGGDVAGGAVVVVDAVVVDVVVVEVVVAVVLVVVGALVVVVGAAVVVATGADEVGAEIATTGLVVEDVGRVGSASTMVRSRLRPSPKRLTATTAATKTAKNSARRKPLIVSPPLRQTSLGYTIQNASFLACAPEVSTRQIPRLGAL
ncbi:MAG: hypothetical protein ACN4GZ_18865 [Acidimicrobiales bacterium]